MSAERVLSPGAVPCGCSDESEGRELSRRDFLKMGLGALGALAALEIGGAALLFLQSRSMKGEFGGIMTLGRADTFPTGSVTEFVDGSFYLVRAHDGGFLAIFRRCPHLGCTVNWVADKNCFYCPCHASSFDFYGDYETPPVPRPLDTFTVRFEQGLVLVDTSELKQREHFTPDQLAYV
jgi:cytochrome b6-f complex iron-sulfur subunit